MILHHSHCQLSFSFEVHSIELNGWRSLMAIQHWAARRVSHPLAASFFAYLILRFICPVAPFHFTGASYV